MNGPTYTSLVGYRTMGQCASFATIAMIAAIWEPCAIPLVLFFLAGAVKAYSRLRRLK